MEGLDHIFCFCVAESRAGSQGIGIGIEIMNNVFKICFNFLDRVASQQKSCEPIEWNYLPHGHHVWIRRCSGEPTESTVQVPRDRGDGVDVRNNTIGNRSGMSDSGLHEQEAGDEESDRAE